MTFRELDKLTKDNPYVLAYRWLRVESFAIGTVALLVGLAMMFEGPSNFEGQVWRGVTTLMPIEYWGALFTAVALGMYVMLAYKRIPVWITAIGATGGSALGTLLLLGGQSPDSSNVPGIFCMGLVVWAAFIVAKHLDLRDDLRASRRLHARLDRADELDEIARREQTAPESSNDS